MTSTPEYTKRAINKYNSKFDRIQVNLPKGTKEKIKELTGLSGNAYISNLVMADLERLEQQQSITQPEIIPEPEPLPEIKPKTKQSIDDLNALLLAEREKRGIKAPEPTEQDQEPPKKKKPLPWQDIPQGIISKYVDEKKISVDK